MATVLIVDDDGHIREVVRFALERAGHRVLEAGDGPAALRALAARPDAVVLDVMLPGEIDGFDICRRIRAGGSEVPILFLSSRDDEIDKVLGLELGGDDYVAKPFSPRELVARVKAMLRRAGLRRDGPPQPVLSHRGLTLDRERHRCEHAGEPVALTATEFDLLAVLLGRPGRVYSRGELVAGVWGDGHHLADRTVDSHIRRIRRKLAAAGADPIETIYGVGYRLREGG